MSKACVQHAQSMNVAAALADIVTQKHTRNTLSDIHNIQALVGGGGQGVLEGRRKDSAFETSSPTLLAHTSPSPTMVARGGVGGGSRSGGYS